jgi:hypothetical protein
MGGLSHSKSYDEMFFNPLKVEANSPAPPQPSKHLHPILKLA